MRESQVAPGAHDMRSSDQTTCTTDAERLDRLYERLQAQRATLVGYPCNQDFDYGELGRFLDFSINNVGDPFGREGHVRMNTHEFEREVIDQFARWTGAGAGDYWGYVTNGGTEGNMYGIYLARELHPDGMVYFSEHTHYSVAKIMRLLHARNLMIKVQPNGELDYDDLRESIRHNPDAPPIVFANIGTTMTGAVDNLDRIYEIMRELEIAKFYVHCDAALSGMILPFVDHPQAFGFADGAHSISISGHKFIGAPTPCGVVLALKKNVERIARSVEYVGVLDTTLSGSRNGFTPLLLWQALRRLGSKGFRERVRLCLDRADHAIDQFASRNVAAWRNPNSITVVLPRPSDAVLDKWQIAPWRRITHLITLPHVTEAIIDEFVDDVATDLLEDLESESP